MKEEWNGVAKAWNEYMTDGDWFQRYIIYPTIMEKVDDISNKTIIDVGCGNGHLTRFFTKNGISAEGIDNSREMIKFCSDKDPKANFYVHDIALSSIPEKVYDVAVFNNSVQDMESYENAIGNIRSNLSDKGELLIIVKHPCFHPTEKDLGWQIRCEDGEILHTGPGLTDISKETRTCTADFFATDHYFDSYSHTRTWFGKKTTSYSRTLEGYIAAILSHGFCITGIYEPRPLPSGQKENPLLYDILMRIPNFIVIKAGKNK